MAGSGTPRTPTFSSRLAFILVTAGAAVGLGNIWGFTYVAGKNGGGGFVLIYLLALAMVAAPVFMAELMMGRMGRACPPVTLNRLQGGRRSLIPWSFPGWIGTAALIVILGYYSVIAGQALYYVFVAVGGGFTDVSADGITALDADFKSGWGVPLMWSALFCGATAVIVSTDIRSGLERAGKWLMPVLFIQLIGLVVFAAVEGDFPRAVDFLFGVSDISLSPRVLMEAVGQAFFTVSVGVGGVMMYGAYMGEDVRLAPATLWIVAMDLAVALLAGLAVFPLVFGFGVEPSAGPGLVFLTLPIVFGQVPGGSVVAFVFFLLLVFAAITSAISMLAPGVARLEEAGVSRTKAAWMMASLAFLFSILTALSFSDWRDFYPLASFGLGGMTWFDLMREGVSNIILPLGALGFALIAGWGIGRERVRASLPMADGILFRVWFAVLRYFVPLAVTALFINSLVS